MAFPLPALETDMPLNRPAQALTPGPRGVSGARRWATQVLTEIQRSELIESACISVSEVITNALLHAEQPVSVRLRGTRNHPRIEVRDGSREPPDLPDLESEPEDDVLLTFGRGLSIVARVSSAWGAEIEEDGKIVWFVPQVELTDGPGVQGLITELQPLLREDPPEVDDPVDVTLTGLPLPEMKDNRIHLRELRRELRLLALGHEATYPLAASLSRFFTDLDATFWRGMRDESLASALLDGADDLDLTITIPRRSGDDFQRFIELLELADAFCRQERLLTLARTSDQVAFQTWMFGEFVRQSHGADALPWRPPGPAVSRHQSVS
jgi:anti-sigma regulatory factor (Ser/Thr protein kinase)